MKGRHSIYNKAKKFFNNLPLQWKLILIYILALILPVMLITFHSIREMVHISNEKETMQSQAQCNQIAANMEVKLNDFYKSVLNFSNSPVVTSYFECAYPDTSAFFSVYPKVNLHIASFLVSNPLLEQLTVYTNNPTFIKNHHTICELTPEIAKEYETLCAGSSSSSITSTVRETASGFCLDFYAQISFTKTPKFQSLLYLSYPEDILYSLYQHESGKTELYLVSPSNAVVSSDDRESLGRDASSLETVQTIEHADLQDSVLTKLGKNYYYTSTFSDSHLLQGWKIYMKVSNEAYLKEMNQLIMQTLLFIFLFSLMGLLLYFLCSISITRRLNRLVHTMSGIRTDETLDVILETDSRDEIGVLAQNFDKMLKRIKKLIFDVYTSDLQVKELELQNKQAQLLALQNQINPHFLFNTMQSLSISCYNNDDYETAAYINKFCAFLRDCLYWETKRVPLSEEIRMVENYLSLQKMRYQDALNYQIHIPANVCEVPIPKFTLQPIVENAIEHGLEQKTTDLKPGLIVIRAQTVSNQIQIIVEDNGAGIAAERLSMLNKQLQSPDSASVSDSIGIFNTNERLKLFYGPAYGLELKSTEGAGTKVIITITTPDTQD